jgi:hypothetical protein
MFLCTRYYVFRFLVLRTLLHDLEPMNSILLMFRHHLWKRQNMKTPFVNYLSGLFQERRTDIKGIDRLYCKANYFQGCNLMRRECV